MDLSTTFASIRKQVAGVSLVALVAGLFATGVATASTSHTFSDVPADAWFASYVNGLADAGVVDANADMYRPGDLVNRAEMSKFAFQVSGLPLETATAAPYSDVPMGQWYTNYIYTLTKNGIVSGDKKDGVPTGWFRPQDALNRAEATKMLVNSAQMAEDVSGAPHFPDVKSSDWFYNFVETTFNHGVVAGYPDGTFKPDNNINRAEAAKMVFLSMNPVKKGFTLDSAAAASLTKVELIFSANVDKVTAETVANYTIEDANGNPLVVSAASAVSADTVDLTVATQTKGKVYYVTVKNVKSEAGDTLSNTDSVSFLGYGADVTGGALNVSLSTETPVSGSVPSGATGVVFTCWDFTGGATDSMVTSLTVHRVGPGLETDFDNVYLYNGDARVTTGRSINNSTQAVQFNNINQPVAAGKNVKLCLVGDLVSTNPATSGGVHAFELANAAAVMSNSSNMTGSFPLRGADQLITSAAVGATTVKRNGSLDEVTIGTVGARIAQFELDADTKEDQNLVRIALYIRGRAPSAALQNLKLYALGDATPVASVASVGQKDLATFVLATPYKIGKGQNKIFYVTADVVGARTGDDIKVYVDQSTDVFVKGSTYGYGTQVVITNYDGSDVDAIPGTADDMYSYVLLKGSKFTIAFNGPAAGDLSVNQKQARCMDVTLTNAAGLDLTIKDWKIKMDATTSAPVAGGLLDTTSTTTQNYTQIQLVQLNDDGTIGGTILGSSELSTTPGDATQDVTLKGTYNIASGQSIKAAITFDVANNTALSGDTVKCSLYAPTGTDQVKDSNNDDLGAANITPSSTIGGNTMNIVAAALTFTKNSSPANATNYAKGTSGATLLAFQAKAGSALDTTIKSLSFAGDNTTGTTDIKDLVDNLGVYSSTGTLLSDLKSFPASGAGVNNAVVTFNNLSIPVAKNGTVNLFLKGMVSNSIAVASTVNFNLNSASSPLVIDGNGQTVTGVDISGVDSAVGAPNSTSLQLVLGTSPTVAPSSTAANDPKMFAEAQTNPVYAFTLKSTNGDSTLQDMTVNLSTSGALLPIDSVALYSATASGACDTATLLKDYESVITNSATTGRVNFTNIGKTLTDSQNIYLCVMLKSKVVTSGTPVSNTDIVMGSIYFDKVQDTSGSALAVTPLFINAGATATAAETVGGGKITSIAVTSQGFGYDPLALPAITFPGTTCSTAPAATATVVDGRVTAITVTADGTSTCTVTGVTVAVPPGPTVTVAPSLFFKGVPTFTPVALQSTVLTGASNEVLKFTAGSIGSVSALDQLAVTLEENIPVTACTLYRGNTPITTPGAESIAIAPVIAGEDVVSFDPTSFTNGVDTPWNNGMTYSVKCSYAGGVTTGDSVKAKLAPTAISGGGLPGTGKTGDSAIIWDDSNGATLTDAAFALVDDVLFLNNVEATSKLSAL